MKRLKDYFNQPLSLRWKWGIFLLIVLIPLAFLSLFIYHHRLNSFVSHEIYVAYQETYQNLNEKLSEFSKPIYRIETPAEDGPVLLDQETQAAVDVIKFFENDEIIVRLFTANNQIIYQTKSINLPSVNHSDLMRPVTVDNKTYYVGFRPIISDKTGHKIGSFQMVIDPVTYVNIENYMNRLFWTILIIVLIFITFLSFILSHRFLKPLSYLNNSLDLVEEENLSDIRVMKPKTNDEWSDLSLHVNRLLDKIDKYVSGQKQFVEDVSHELRTPVAIVEGHLKLLNRWGKDDPEILEESIEASLQEISRMKDLVQEMLDLSRADNVDVDYKDEITEVYSTTKQVYNNFSLIHQDFIFYLEADDQDEDLYIQAFRNHYEQILIILLDNAVKYSKDRKEIHISISRGVSRVEIAIQDFGEGMSEEDKEKVFGRFYRIDKARSRDKGGNGLGLSIAQQLVHGYKGNIRVESVLYHGSIFYIDFPILTSARQIYKSKKIAQRRNL